MTNDYHRSCARTCTKCICRHAATPVYQTPAVTPCEPREKAFDQSDCDHRNAQWHRQAASCVKLACSARSRSCRQWWLTGSTALLRTGCVGMNAPSFACRARIRLRSPGTRSRPAMCGLGATPARAGSGWAAPRRAPRASIAAYADLAWVPPGLNGTGLSAFG